MSELVADCPRCGAGDHTLDVLADIYVGIEYNWQTKHEVHAVCRRCHLGATFRVELRKPSDKAKFLKLGSLTAYNGTLNDVIRVVRPITLRDLAGSKAPDHVPNPIKGVFEEGSSSFAAACYNAAGAMFRLTLDLTTKHLLPAADDENQKQPNAKQRGKLYDRLEFLFDTDRLPRSLKALATCIREDGNDGAHDGNLTKADAEDLLDFSTAMLERVYSEPARLQEAEQRRKDRRKEA